MEMVEIRGWIPNFEIAVKKIESFGFISKGSYKFKDFIYHPCNQNYDLNREFMRLRFYEKNNWHLKLENPVIIVHKVRAMMGISGQMVWKSEFKTLAQAENVLHTTHRFAFSASRTGTEYEGEGLRLFVEEIEFLQPSIEIIAQTRENIIKFLHRLGPVDVIEDSVPHLIANALRIKAELSFV